MKSRAWPDLLALRFALLFTLLLAPGIAPQAAFAQTGTPDTTSGYGFSSGAASAMHVEAGAELEQHDAAALQPHTSGDVTYLCGGIGDGEARFMQAQARSYDLQLIFAARSGAYLADVDVRIRDAAGREVLRVHCGAPMLLVDLPRSGIYRIEADAAGFTQSRTARIAAGRANLGKSGTSVVVSWPDPSVAKMRPADAPLTSGASENGGEEGSPGGSAGAGDGH